MVECMFIWPHIFFQIYLCKCLSQLRLSERTRTHKFPLLESSRFYSTLVDSSLPTYLGIYVLYVIWIFKCVHFTLSYSQVKSICNFLSLLD